MRKRNRLALALIGWAACSASGAGGVAWWGYTNLAGQAGTTTSGSADGTNTTARFKYPFSIAADPASGNFYIADYGNSTIRKLTPSGAVTTFAGLAGSAGSADGTGSAARFNYPQGVAVDCHGNVFVSDTFNSTLRKITPAGVVTTLAGSPGSPGTADGPTNVARFYYPAHIAVDTNGNVYVAEYWMHTIRKLTPEGVVSTLAGLAGSAGSADGTNTGARFNNPNGITVAPDGNLYVADRANNTIRKITPDGVVTTVAGLAGAPGSADGTNVAARFSGPYGVGADSNNNLFVADSGNSTLRRITPAGVVTTVGGRAGQTGTADGTNSQARFNSPSAIAVDGTGHLYVADYSNHRISKGWIHYPPPPSITTTNPLPAGIQWNAYSLAFTATGGQAPYSWSLSAGALPSGVTLSPAGLLSGTPSVASTFTFQVCVTGSDGASSSADITFPVTAPTPPVITSGSPLPSGTAGRPYVCALAATGGFPPYTWSLDSGSLPPGLSLSASGVISGTPSVAGAQSFTVLATGTNFGRASANYTLEIFTPPHIDTASELPPGLTGQPYSCSLAGSGALAPYTWELVSGSLPAGLTLSTAGTINGTPSEAGAFAPVIRMVAASGSAATNSFTLAMTQGVPLAEGFEHGGAMPSGWTQEFVVNTVSWIFQKGGHGSPANAHSGLFNGLLYSSSTADHKTRLITPMIDFGTNTAAELSFWLDTKLYYLNQDNLSVYYRTSAEAPWALLGSRSYSSWTKVVMPLPTPTRTYFIAFEGNARGGYGVCLDDVSVVAVAPPSAPAITTAALPSATVYTPYSHTLEASGGSSPYTWALAAGSLPNGLTLSGNQISGKPAAVGHFPLSIMVTGANGYSTTSQLSIAVNPVSLAGSETYRFTTLAGGTYGYADGTNSSAQFNGPVGVDVAGDGTVIVGDTMNHLVRIITADGAVTTLAGTPRTPGTNDGVRSAALFNEPCGVAVDSLGQILVADRRNATIRGVTTNGVVCTLAGYPGRKGIDLEHPEDWFYFYDPHDVAFRDGICYVGDTVNNLVSLFTPPDPFVSVVAGLYPGTNDGAYLSAQFRYPEGLAADRAGNLFVADTANSTIRKITASRQVTTIAGVAGSRGSVDGTNATARFDFPAGIAADAAGNLFVCDRMAHTIRRITPQGVVTTIGGVAGLAGKTEEAGLASRFNGPCGIAVDAAGNLFIADTGNNRIVKGTPVEPLRALPFTADGCFGLNLTGPSGLSVVIEACSDLTSPVWEPLSTNILVSGTSLFADPDSSILNRRFYRIFVQ